MPTNNITPSQPPQQGATPVLIFIVIAVPSFFATLWYIAPAILEAVDFTGLFIGLFIIACLCAVACGKRINAERIVRGQDLCRHVKAGDVCYKCDKEF